MEVFMKRSILILILALSACAPIHGQNRYNFSEAGQATEVIFGTVLRMRPVDIVGKNSGLGMTAGMAAGSAAGYQIGNGNGQLAGLLAGMLVGGIAGHIAEQEMQNYKGYEYLVKLKGGKTITVVQNQQSGDVVFKKGDKVMVQSSGQYQRVMEAE
jgi:outer membrane lipoprotein SlyB